jgi:hypothetical protein
MKKIKLIVALISLVIPLASCGGATSGYNTAAAADGDIDPAVGAEVRLAYDAVLSGLRGKNNTVSVMPLPDKPFTPAAAEDSGRAAEFSPGAVLSEIVEGEGKILGEVHVVFGKNIVDGQRVEIAEAAGLGGEGFMFELKPYAREMYVILSSFSRGAIDYLIYAALAKTGDGWKLYEIRYDEYAYEGMDAAALYRKAGESSGAKEIVPAAVYAYCAGRVLTPCGIVRGGSDETAGGIAPLIEAVNQKYKFPFKLTLAEESAGKETEKETADADKTAELLGFEPMVSERGIEVIIKYFTETDIGGLVEARDAGKDAEPPDARRTAENERALKRLEAEAKEILEFIDRPFSGVANGLGNVRMAAYNRIETEPEDKESPDGGRDKENSGGRGAERREEYEYIVYIISPIAWGEEPKA